jgi:carboxymethylenebutenolidase
VLVYQRNERLPMCAVTLATNTTMAIEYHVATDSGCGCTIILGNDAIASGGNSSRGRRVSLHIQLPRESVVRQLPWLCHLLLVLFTGQTFAHPAAITIYTARSEPFAAQVAGPKESSKAVVLVHDWFGVSPFYVDAAEKLGQLGYRVVAVDLYGGRRATTHEEASALLGGLHDDLAARELDAAIKLSSEGGRKVAVFGFSMGVKHALAAALRNSSVRTTVLWYGETINDPEALRHLAGPAMLIKGSHDGPSAAEGSLAFSKAADMAGVGAEVYVYPGADHAFAQPLFNQGRTYDPIATSVAWSLTESFLDRRLR